MTQAPVTNDFGNSASDRLASMAHETIDRVAPKANRVEHELRGAAAKAAEGAKVLQDNALQTTEENLRKVRSFIENNPFATAGIAFAAGALLGAWVRR
jgi:ElaB/YqjD/DUF883 family membrane-anchored ribosome-binding protein